MSTIHTSPVHFKPPVGVGLTGQTIVATDNLGDTSWQFPPIPVLPPNTVQIFFSQKIGSDVTGTGSYTNPYSSIGFAYAAAGTPTSTVFIIGLDGETYDEQLIFDSSYKFINAQFAHVQYTGAGDAVTVTASGAGFPIILATIGATSGNAVVNTSTEIVVIETGALLGGDIVNAGTGAILINSQIADVNFTNLSTGSIFYNVTTRLGGTDSVGVQGISPQAATGPFKISGLSYPTSDAASGSVMTTDGAGVLTLQPSTPGFSSINVQTFTTSGTYTPTAGMSYCIVECVGSGGGGGGAASAAGHSASGGGGGGGAYARSVLSAATVGVSQVVTVGVGGAGGAAGNNNGSNGSASSLGVLVEADGGGGGFGAAASATLPSFGIYGAGGGSGIGQLVKNGDSGLLGLAWGASLIGIGGQGGNSFYGIGGEQLINLAGANGFNYGSGGGGGSSGNTGAVTGGNGASGIVIITEYIV